jgi:hypothetical protein
VTNAIQPRAGRRTPAQRLGLLESISYLIASFPLNELQLDPTFVQPYTFTSREFDTEAGLYYYRTEVA